MSYVLNTPEQQQEMLKKIGVDSIDELFEQIPEDYRLEDLLPFGEGMTEIELEDMLRWLASFNGGSGSRICLQGGGAYDHFIPAAVDEIASRGEYYTAYTPYQAEASQGTLQVMFEYQSLICDLTGMDVSNASLYEGGTAVSEAAFMAQRATKRHGKVVVLGSVHPEYRNVLSTYRTELDCEVVTVPVTDGAADIDAVKTALDDQTACLIIQQPNFYGCLEDAQALVDAAHEAGALAIVSVDPISLGVLKRPGDYGADIVVAEGQALGVPLQYGGPLLGLLACRKKFTRMIPGRLVGKTTDREGKPCYVLNLQAREQHIRRDKATSNICTNQGLLALRATVYLSLVGPQGLKEAATTCCELTNFLSQRLSEIEGFSLAYDRPHFKEFVLQCEKPVEDVIAAAAEHGFDLGPALDRFGDDENLPKNSLLIAVTEKRSMIDLEELVKLLAEF